MEEEMLASNIQRCPTVVQPGSHQNLIHGSQDGKDQQRTNTMAWRKDEKDKLAKWEVAERSLSHPFPLLIGATKSWRIVGWLAAENPVFMLRSVDSM